MTATEEIFARVEAVAGGARGGLENHELAALRGVLVGPERGQIRKILQRLDDPATRAAEIARILPEAMALRGAEDEALAETLTPVVRQALAEALRERPDLLVAAVRTALREMMWAPWRCVGRAFRRHRGETARVEQLYLIKRESGEIIEQTMRATNVEDDHAEEDSRRVASMVTYLLAFLRDPEHLLRYAGLGQVRIDRLTYGICAGAGVVLLTVIHGRRGAEEELARCREMLMKMDREWCGGKRERGDHVWLPRLEEACEPATKVEANENAPVTGGDGRVDSHAAKID